MDLTHLGRESFELTNEERETRNTKVVLDMMLNAIVNGISIESFDQTVAHIPAAYGSRVELSRQYKQLLKNFTIKIERRK